MAPKQLIIVPTYNEVENIAELIAQVRAAAPLADLLVVDDNSPDGTARVVRNLLNSDSQVYLLNRARKEGLAAAYIAGFRWGLERNYEHIVQMDADFSHSPQDVPRIFDRLKSSDVVIGCRYIQGGGTSGWSWLRQGISRGGNFYAQTMLRLPFQDLTGGFNGWRASVLKDLDLGSIRSQGYAYQVEMKFRAHSKNFRISEMPIHFENRKLGRSKMSGRIVWEAAFRVLQMKRSVPA